MQAAWAAVKVKGSYLQAQFHRLRARRGAKKAIIGVAASMLTAIWHMLRNGTEWNELGATYFDRADAKKTATRLIRRLSANRLFRVRAGRTSLSENVSFQWPVVVGTTRYA